MSPKSLEQSPFAARPEQRPKPLGRPYQLLTLAILYGIWFLVLASSASLLPARVASHFGIQGQPNGWMSRESYLWLMGGLCTIMPLFILAISQMPRVCPPGMINLPHREHWLSPEHRHETIAFLSGRLGWLACFMLTFFMGLHWLVVDANRQQPAHMSGGLWIIAGAFLAAILGWSIMLIRHFSRVPAAVTERNGGDCQDRFRSIF